MARAMAYEIEICWCGTVMLVCCCCCRMVVGRPWERLGLRGESGGLPVPGMARAAAGVFRCCHWSVGDDALNEAVDGGDGFVA